MVHDFRSTKTYFCLVLTKLVRRSKGASAKVQKFTTNTQEFCLGEGGKNQRKTGCIV